MIHTKAFERKKEILDLKRQIQQLQDKLDRLVEKDKYYIEQDQRKLEEKRKEEQFQQSLNQYQWFDMDDLEKLYQTREELMEAECNPNEIGRIDWENWDRVVRETKKWIRQR